MVCDAAYRHSPDVAKLPLPDVPVSHQRQVEALQGGEQSVFLLLGSAPVLQADSQVSLFA